MSFLVQVMNETKSTSINPYMQGNLYYYEFWRYEPRCYSNLHQFSCCPALLMELVGPSLRVSGLAFADQFMCQPLTPAISLLTMAALDREQVAAAVQALVVLRCTVHAVRQSYSVLQQNLPLLQQPDALQQHYAARAQQLLLGQQMQEGLVPRDLLLQRLPYRLQVPCVNVQRLMPSKELYVVACQNHQPRLCEVHTVLWHGRSQSLGRCHPGHGSTSLQLSSPAWGMVGGANGVANHSRWLATVG